MCGASKETGMPIVPGERHGMVGHVVQSFRKEWTQPRVAKIKRGERSITSDM